MLRIVLFDGICNLCHTTVQQLIAWDKDKVLQFASLQSHFGLEILHDLGWEKQEFKSFIYLRENQVYTKSTAAIEVLSDISPRVEWARALYIFPKFLRDAVYEYIAKNRYKWFGKKENCWLPTPDLTNRFME